MNEYIEREAAIEATKHAWAKGLEPSQYIETIPAANVAPVRHGRWIQCKYMDKSAKCSECGGYYTRFTVNERYPEYCPYCGAKMDGDPHD